MYNKELADNVCYRTDWLCILKNWLIMYDVELDDNVL